MFFSLCVGYTPRLVAAQQVGRALALTMGGTSAGFILGVPILTALGTACGWRAAFGTLALLTVLTLLLIARLLPAVGNEIPSRDAGTGHGRSVLAAVAVSNATTYLGQFTLYTFISVVLLAAGVRPAFVGPLLLACGLCGLVGLWYAGRTLDRNPRKTIVVILGIAIAAVLTLGAVFPALATTVVAVTVWNGAFGGALSVFQASAVRAGVASPEAAGAWVNAAANIGIAGGAAIGATALPLIGPSGLPWVTAALIGLGLAVALVARQAFPSRI